MTITDSEAEPESVKLRHLAGRNQSTSFFDKRKVIPILAYQLGYHDKPSLYDATVTLDAGDNYIHDICYDHVRNRIWIVTEQSPTRVLRMNPEDFTYDRLTLPVGVNDGYRIAFDGKWIWVTTSDEPAEVVRINPDSLAYDVLELPANRNSANGLCIGGLRGQTRYAWVACRGDAPVAVYILRFDPDDWPNYDEVELRAATGVGYTTPREVVFDGQYIWIGDARGRVCRVDPTTMAAIHAVQIDPTNVKFNNIYGGCWDGSYLWWGDDQGSVARMNPVAPYGYDMMSLPFSPGSLIHAMRSDGKYVHFTCHNEGYYYIIHPETMEYSIHEFVNPGYHGICFDGTCIWLIDSLAIPSIVERYMVHEPSRRFEHGQTDTFAADALANISIAVVFDMPFSRVPNVVVSLNELTDQAADIVNVEAETITVNGFNARCRVAGVGAGGSTCRFGWIATERSTYNP